MPPVRHHHQQQVHPIISAGCPNDCALLRLSSMRMACQLNRIQGFFDYTVRPVTVIVGAFGFHTPAMHLRLVQTADYVCQAGTCSVTVGATS
jgi:hypothetical protein